jgi:hypothetical protein
MRAVSRVAAALAVAWTLCVGAARAAPDVAYPTTVADLARAVERENAWRFALECHVTKVTIIHDPASVAPDQGEELPPAGPGPDTGPGTPQITVQKDHVVCAPGSLYVERYLAIVVSGKGTVPLAETEYWVSPRAQGVELVRFPQIANAPSGRRYNARATNAVSMQYVGLPEWALDISLGVTPSPGRLMTQLTYPSAVLAPAEVMDGLVCVRVDLSAEEGGAAHRLALWIAPARSYHLVRSEEATSYGDRLKVLVETASDFAEVEPGHWLPQHREKRSYRRQGSRGDWTETLTKIATVVGLHTVGGTFSAFSPRLPNATIVAWPDGTESVAGDDTTALEAALRQGNLPLDTMPPVLHSLIGGQ